MRTVALVAFVLLACALAGALAPATAGASVTPQAGPPPVGNLTGPSLVATDWNASFFLNASGGPAGTGSSFLGTIGWNATLSGSNTTGSSVTPGNGTITNITRLPVKLTVATGAIAEPMRLVVRVTSTLKTENATVNLTASFRIVVPYIVRATLVAGPHATVLPFNVTVALDGTVVGTVTVPRLAPNATYDLAFRYPSTGLSVGDHTFTLSVADAHGLVTFSNGLTVQSTSFYVGGPSTSYTVWYVAGIVAFFGVLFIYATRVAARRQGAARR